MDSNFLKKIENIWYYYKAYILVGITILFLIITTIVNKVNEPKFDHSIAIISKSNYPSQENVDKLISIYEDKYGGEFKVEIYNLALGQLGEDEVILSKLSLDLGNKISEYYFIEDMDAFKKATDNIEFESVALVSQIDWLNNLGLDNFYYCIRK